MKPSDWKLTTRLCIGFGLMLLMLALLGTLSSLRIMQNNQSIQDILNDRYAKVKLANAIKFEASEQTRALRDAVIGGADPEEIRASLEKIAGSIKKNDQLLASLKQLINTAKGEALFKAVIDARASYGAARTTAIRLIQDGKLAEAGSYVLKGVRGPQDAFFGALTAMTDFQEERMSKDGAQTQANGKSAITFTLVLSAIAVIIATIVGILTARSVTRPVKRALDLATAVANGDLSQKIDVTGKDEVSLLLHALQAMSTNLQSIVGQVRAGTSEIAVASKEIAQGNLDLSSRTEQQASSLEETASSMEELTSTVKQNGENARRADQLAQSATDIARRGGAIVGEVVSTMGAINSSANKIVDIIGVIDGIAFQTNILALNAAVEAARAGEQGRGFAVVASEVRNLAQRSAAAAKEIKSLIGDSLDKVNAGNELVATAGVTMLEVVDGINRVTTIMAEITAAGREQESGIDQINQAVSEMDAVTQQNAALVEQAAAATASLEQQAAQLSDVVSVFTLDNAAMLAQPPRLGRKSVTARPALQKTDQAPAKRAAPVAERIAHEKAAMEWEQF